MKTSTEWLSDFLPGPIDPHQAGEKLTHAGLTVELYEQHGDDTVFDVEVTSNRSDCLCHMGVARELSALFDRPFNPVKPAAVESSSAASAVTSVRIDALDLCPHYTARILQNLKIGPSPAWMVRRLESIGVRAINNVVDVTNYVMFEMGQPLHAFDFDKLHGRQIIVRRARAGEKIVSIDAKERELLPDMLVIADADRPVALAGVMGGLRSEVSDATVNVLLESARFDPLSVRKTARALTMASPSSYRFERGLDPTLPERASLRAAQLMLELAGGQLLQGIVQAGAVNWQPKKLSLRLSKLASVLGIDVKPEEAVNALARLGFQPVLSDARIDVTVPSHRLDINIEVDLVEEVARLIGYARIPMRDEISIRVVAPEPSAKTINTIRDVLVGGGYFEAVTFSFMSDAMTPHFASAATADGGRLLRADPSVRKADANLRPSILPGLLEAVARNENAGNTGARLFEIGATFRGVNDNKIEEIRRVGLVGGSDLADVRGAVELLLARLDSSRPVQIVPDARVGFSANACGRIVWGGQSIGFIGRIDSGIVKTLALRDTPAAAEIELSPLLDFAQHVPQLKPLPRFPAVRRDLTLDLREEVRYADLEAAIRGVNPDGLEDLEYVTTYRGKPLEAGFKSVTVTLIFRSPTGTLTSEQVDDAMRRVITAAAEKLSAKLR